MQKSRRNVRRKGPGAEAPKRLQPSSARSDEEFAGKFTPEKRQGSRAASCRSLVGRRLRWHRVGARLPNAVAFSSREFPAGNATAGSDHDAKTTIGGESCGWLFEGCRWQEARGHNQGRDLRMDHST